MKLSKNVFFEGLFLSLILGSGCFSQNVSVSKGLKEADIKLTIEPVKAKFKTDDNGEIRVSLKNKFTATVFRVATSGTDMLTGYEVEIDDSSAKRLRKTKDPYPSGGIGSLTSYWIRSNETEERLISLSDFFDLPPGKYVIRFAAEVHNATVKEAVWVKSNRIEVSVTK